MEPRSSPSHTTSLVLSTNAAVTVESVMANINPTSQCTMCAIVSFNVAAQAPLKLTPSNYLSWHLQFLTLLTGYDSHVLSKQSRSMVSQPAILRIPHSYPIKGSQTITEFIQNIKTEADELTLMNIPVDTEDFTIKILNGLDEDYKELANATLSRETTITFKELHEKLLNHEAQLAIKKGSQITLPTTANTAAKSTLPNKSNNQYIGPRQTSAF
ncbi:hypothetical protein RJ641_003651 [Dillenia turbinata]|uniref:Retrotransposon Copia-like N-terminal domain-containing protein n=1 Tax=Dillenia turbinata TaxID=194707 RepID=A0AAN8VQ70_9MAGN